MNTNTQTTSTTSPVTTPTPKKESKTLIYVSNLPFDTTDEQFKDLFNGFNVRTAYIARRKSGRSKGFGFVNLEKDSDQNAVIEKINGKEFESRKLIAKIAMDDERRDEKGELREEFRTISNQNKSEPSDTVVYVSNLEWSVKDEDLKKLFAEFNPKSANVASRRNGRSKGFGFVEFNTKEDQEKALKLDNQKIGGRDIIVKASTGFRGDSNNSNNNNRDNRRDNNRRNDSRRNDNRDNNRRNDNNRSGDNNRRNNDNNRSGSSNLNVVRRNNSNFTLHISNLPLELDENDLRDVFSEFHPRNARIVNGRNGSSKGYGFIEFNNSKDQNEAQRALDQSEINGRVVGVKLSTSGQNGGRNNNNNDNRRNNDSRRNDNRRNDNNRNNDNRGGDNRRNNDNRGGDNRRNNDNRGGDNRRNNDSRRNNNNNRNNDQNQKPKEISPTLVYVSNLPFDLDDKGLEEVFKGLKVSRAYVTRRRNGYSKGFGFVEFASPEDQQKAIGQNASEIKGRKIVVQAAFKVDNPTNNTNTNTTTTTTTTNNTNSN